MGQKGFHECNNGGNYSVNASNGSQLPGLLHLGGEIYQNHYKQDSDKSADYVPHDPPVYLFQENMQFLMITFLFQKLKFHPV